MGEEEDSLEPSIGHTPLLRQIYSTFVAFAAAHGCSEQQAVLVLYELAVSDLERLAPPDDVSASDIPQYPSVLH